MRCCSREDVAPFISGRSVALVGSGPGSLRNAPGFVDGHDTVVRVNNYRVGSAQGTRCDIHYSFFGTSIRKTAAELKRDGVKLCICKCPDAKIMDSAWHTQKQKPNGVDFRYIYENRAAWWFGPVYVPTLAEFMMHFHLLGGHIPTTGFAALLDVLSYGPRSVYMTGFDFFQSGLHNVNETWKPGDPSDPIGHDPAAERAWFIAHAASLPVTCDDAMAESLAGEWKAPPVVPPKPRNVTIGSKGRRTADRHPVQMRLSRKIDPRIVR